MATLRVLGVEAITFNVAEWFFLLEYSDARIDDVYVYKRISPIQSLRRMSRNCHAVCQTLSGQCFYPGSIDAEGVSMCYGHSAVWTFRHSAAQLTEIRFIDTTGLTCSADTLSRIMHMTPKVEVSVLSGHAQLTDLAPILGVYDHLSLLSLQNVHVKSGTNKSLPSSYGAKFAGDRAIREVQTVAIIVHGSVPSYQRPSLKGCCSLNSVQARTYEKSGGGLS